VIAKVPFAVVLRLSGFQFSQSDLETRLKVALERYSLDKDGYAQLTVESDELDVDWEIVGAFLQRHGPVVKGLLEKQDVRSACLDLAYDFREGLALASYTLPAQTAVLAGSHNIDVMFSVYLTSP
jgi:hypothetical protein